MMDRYRDRRYELSMFALLLGIVGVAATLWALSRAFSPGESADLLGSSALGFVGVLLFVWILAWLFCPPDVGPWIRLYEYPARSQDRAVELLRDRYARGELTREQYRQMVEDLGARP